MRDLPHQLAIEPHFGTKSRALVVDPHVTTRSIVAAQLRGLGVGQVLHSATAHEARQQMQKLGVDLLLVEHQLDRGQKGQDLIDELRRAGLLPLRTVVIMLSALSTYRVVAEVAESALDGFVIKPHTPGQLEDRLIAAFVRKTELKPVFDALENELHEKALALCEARFGARARYWTHAARIGAELAMRLDRLPLASTMYAAVMADKAVPWAKLGLARVLEAAGERGEAVSTIQNLLADEPRYADAYDVMGRIYADQGDLAGAINAYRQAVEITPHSVVRAQKYGILAWYAAERDVATAALEHAAEIGLDSPSFDHQTLLLLAMARFDSGDAAGLKSCNDKLQHCLGRIDRAERLAPAGEAAETHAQRLRRLQQMAQALVAVQAHDKPLLAACLGRVADELLAPHFDIEAATNLLSLISTSHAADLPPPQARHWVRSAGLRFCISKQVTEVLARACDKAPPLAETVREAQAEINEISRNALSEGLAGAHGKAVQQLLDAVERTRNARLLEMAHATLGRHAANIADAEELEARWQALQQLCGGVVKGRLLQTDGQRTAASASGLPIGLQRPSADDLARAASG